MASKTVNVGSRGRWKTVVDQLSQNVAANTSRVRVRGIMYNDGSGTSADRTGNCKASISGEDSWSDSSVTFSVSGGGSKTLIDREFTVPHAADGTKTVSYTCKFGPTITSTFGNGGSAKVTMALTSIPKVPHAVAAPSVSLIVPTDLSVSWSAPNQGGASIDGYRIRCVVKGRPIEEARTWTIGATRTYTLSGLALGTTYLIDVRAHNSLGWGDYGPDREFTIPNVPAKMAKPSVVYTPPFTGTVSFVVPSNGGSPIRGYHIQYANNAAFSNAQQARAGSTPTSVYNLFPGAANYVRIRAYNDQGEGPWSDSVITPQVIGGPYLKWNGAWNPTAAYVRHQGVWKLAVPYVRHNGVWKVVGG